jgi:guanylate kinase
MIKLSDNIQHQNKKLFVLSSPSGGGKSTLAKYLMKNHPNVQFSISCTTRQMRTGEVEGKDYYFLTKDQFLEKLKNNEFAETEEIFGNFYGTLKSEIEQKIQGNSYILFDVDVKGALSLKKAFPDNSLLIFIAPPSETELERRLRNRGTETDEQIKNRLARAAEELELIDAFDYVIVNDDLQQACMEIDIIGARYITNNH